MSRPKPPPRALENDLWTRAADIWAVCRGLGWTLDSERAVKIIQGHLQVVEDSYTHRIERLEKELEDAEKDIDKLKKYISSHRMKK